MTNKNNTLHDEVRNLDTRIHFAHSVMEALNLDREGVVEIFKGDLADLWQIGYAADMARWEALTGRAWSVSCPPGME